ncbi:hypothetical protein BT96DRAFT_1013684 [Gymnopus androsaceus JB14]|uniref:Uncharacterized protein n=1 Tax=Gymnopus androsaceus JB14 TaxID=1447944 RepID=A0A6A4IG38_9AGAR|nr:hypothetical protein BT96DRAFT_1013684 [Gymnopus androsaceus JB14]
MRKAKSLSQHSRQSAGQAEKAKAPKPVAVAPTKATKTKEKSQGPGDEKIFRGEILPRLEFVRATQGILFNPGSHAPWNSQSLEHIQARKEEGAQDSPKRARSEDEQKHRSSKRPRGEDGQESGGENCSQEKLRGKERQDHGQKVEEDLGEAASAATDEDLFGDDSVE